ncbi:MAG: DUF3276 family protein, partial [Thermoanaerobaculia bacterium]|nr:DUF3276 family protein [Thermoanaerobaculia bacterium]
MLILLLAMQLSALSANDVVERAIDHHDPESGWATLEHTFSIRETRPDGTERRVELTLDHPGDRFVYEAEIGGDHVLKRLENGECHAEINGSTDVSKEQEKKYRDEVYSQRVPAGRRTYYLDVKPTRSGDDFYITITERKRLRNGGSEKYKVFLYKEDFGKFIRALHDVMDHIRDERLPEYDFRTHSRTGRDVEVHPRPVVLVEGILVLAHDDLRDRFDHAVFVHVPDDIRLIRRI